MAVGERLSEPEVGWKRIDDTDPYIKYTGRRWKTVTVSGSYNESQHYTGVWGSSSIGEKGESVSFNFYGSKIRIYSFLGAQNSSDISIIIDNIYYNTSQLSSVVINSGLIFECLELDKKVHVVKIVNNQATQMFFDCIDIDDDGYLEPLVGTKLTEPYTGWRRVDDTNEYLRYIGNWATETGKDTTQYYNGTRSYTKDISSYLEFNFYGSRIMIISATDPSYRPANLICEIDGIKYSFSEALSSEYMRVVFEKMDLNYGIHHVKIYPNVNENKYMTIDAIDLDEDARIFQVRFVVKKDYGDNVVYSTIDESGNIAQNMSLTNLVNSTKFKAESANNVFNRVLSETDITPPVSFIHILGSKE